MSLHSVVCSPSRPPFIQALGFGTLGRYKSLSPELSQTSHLLANPHPQRSSHIYKMARAPSSLQRRCSKTPLHPLGNSVHPYQRKTSGLVKPEVAQKPWGIIPSHAWSNAAGFQIQLDAAHRTITAARSENDTGSDLLFCDVTRRHSRLARRNSQVSVSTYTPAYGNLSHSALSPIKEDDAPSSAANSDIEGHIDLTGGRRGGISSLSLHPEEGVPSPESPPAPCAVLTASAHMTPVAPSTPPRTLTLAPTSASPPTSLCPGLSPFNLGTWSAASPAEQKAMVAMVTTGSGSPYTSPSSASSQSPLPSPSPASSRPLRSQPCRIHRIKYNAGINTIPPRPKLILARDPPSALTSKSKPESGVHLRLHPPSRSTQRVQIQPARQARPGNPQPQPQLTPAPASCLISSHSPSRLVSEPRTLSHSKSRLHEPRDGSGSGEEAVCEYVCPPWVPDPQAEEERASALDGLHSYLGNATAADFWPYPIAALDRGRRRGRGFSLWDLRVGRIREEYLSS
ncbi:hypothetical protein BOTBODRAFT_144716 [Botryobasidium botryosum FD-172 SS1]|uniref:Uncharacterized protein n=1 Tax=Botryobasidium botryosum (strain FD-172 SS1) TaxID=930990 RepID=A0A067MWX5_BOTB1|nr:hypothetical protein BOTBODRAFT_144716 [Botryobasidium botryosum FD-172 SS1]